VLMRFSGEAVFVINLEQIIPSSRILKKKTVETNGSTGRPAGRAAARKMETDENSSGALGAGEHGGGSHQL
jgi:hypothetical protein